MATALIPLAKGFEEVEAITVIDVLRRGGVSVVTAALTDEMLVLGAHGMSILADARFADVCNQVYDVIVLPGGSEGVENLKNSESVYRCLRAQKEAGRLIAAICAAPTVLVEGDLLEPGQQVTCYPTCQMDLDRQWTPAPVVVDDLIVTSQAPGTAMLFSLVILRMLSGDAVANRVARGMVTDEPA